jgi:hypothetical protein
MNPVSAPDLTRAAWLKSSRSSGGGSNCIEVAQLPSRIAIRDSKDPLGATLIIAPTAFRELTSGIKHRTCKA